MPENADGAKPEKLSPLQRLLFGFPSLPHALVAYPVYSLLPAYYAANTKVTLVEIGAIAAASRIFDAVNDPVIGYLSDRTRTRFGGRKPWYLASIVFLLAGSIFLLTASSSRRSAHATIMLARRIACMASFAPVPIPGLRGNAELAASWHFAHISAVCSGV